jgi:hypothetical protein
MPRVASESSALLADLHSRLQNVLAAARAEGHAKALDEIRSLVGGGGAPVKRGPGRPRGSKNAPKVAAAAKPKRKRKNSWAGLSAADRLARVNAIRKGKGLPPKEA